MSATELPPNPPAPPPPPEGDPVPETCPRCGAPLKPDQDWCLNCGAAVTTEVAGAPAWRAPIAVVGVVLALASVALVFAFVRLSDDDTTVAPVPAATPTVAAAPAIVPTPTLAPGETPIPGASTTLTPTPTPTLAPGETPTPIPGITPTPTPGTTPGDDAPEPTPGANGAFADWPAGKTAYTVILWSAGSRSEAERKAQGFSDAGTTVGILKSGDFSSLRAGYFVVFSGEYDALQAAQDAAEGAQATAPGAYAKQVKPK